MTRRRVAFALLAVLLVAGVGVGTWLWLTRERPPTRSATALCERLSGTVGLDMAIVTLDPTRLGPLVAELEQSVLVAPPDILEPLSNLASFVGEVTDAVRAEPTDKKQALVDALAARQDRVDSVTNAGVLVEQWTQANCGTALRSTTSTTSRTTTTTARTTTTSKR